MDSEEPRLGLDENAPGAESPRAEAPYRVLARKYRPQNFTGLIGQDALVTTLRNAFASGRIAHGFMLSGVRGVGKTTTARIIARALNCIGPDGQRDRPTIDPCGMCDPCVAIAESRHVDVQEMDAASRTGIDDIREIIEGTRYAPASARYKVYIIDEVHMLSKQAFNGLLKTLEEPPPHVKFIFATTEIRKVPVTVLSRCQRFDLRRIETGTLAAHLGAIAEKEHIAIEPGALSLLARAAEGSVRDGLSLLDQAIAHDAEGGTAIGALSVRAMLGLADRGRVLDLFEKLMGGEIAHALTLFRALYEDGADPLVVMQDLLETTHFLTRVKVAPGAEGFFDGGSTEAARAVTMAGKLPVPSLTRAWQMLLKGLIEVRDAAHPYAAAEMALVRLSHAADLPPTERLVRSLREGAQAAQAAAPGPVPTPRAGPAPASEMRAPQAATTPIQAAQMQATPMQAAPMQAGAPRAQAAVRPEAQVQSEALSSVPVIESLADVVQLAKANGARTLATQLETNVHLVSLEPGRIQFRPNALAPATLAGDLAQRLRDWTGVRWIVTLASAGGAPTIVEARSAADRAQKDALSQEPFVRAVLDAFPGAEIVAVRERDEPDSGLPPVLSDDDLESGEEPA